MGQCMSLLCKQQKYIIEIPIFYTQMKRLLQQLSDIQKIKQIGNKVQQSTKSKNNMKIIIQKNKIKQISIYWMAKQQNFNADTHLQMNFNEKAGQFFQNKKLQFKDKQQIELEQYIKVDTDSQQSYGQLDTKLMVYIKKFKNYEKLDEYLKEFCKQHTKMNIELVQQQNNKNFVSIEYNNKNLMFYGFNETNQIILFGRIERIQQIILNLSIHGQRFINLFSKIIKFYQQINSLEFTKLNFNIKPYSQQSSQYLSRLKQVFKKEKYKLQFNSSNIVNLIVLKNMHDRGGLDLLDSQLQYKMQQIIKQCQNKEKVFLIINVSPICYLNNKTLKQNFIKRISLLLPNQKIDSSIFEKVHFLHMQYNILQKKIVHSRQNNKPFKQIIQQINQYFLEQQQPIILFSSSQQ